MNLHKWLIPKLGFLGLCLITSCQQKPISTEVVKHHYVHAYGTPISADEWELTGKTGTEIIHLKSGVVITKAYKDGALHGDTTRTFPYSEVVSQRDSYEAGKLITQRLYLENGLPIKEIKYVDNNKKEMTTWFESGAPQSTEIYQNDLLISGSYFTPQQEVESTIQEGKGSRIIRNSKGELVLAEEFVTNQKISEVTYHSNGVPAAKAPYVNGVVHGKRETFHEDGTPLTEEEWVNGQQHGTTILFQNGKKQAEISYVQGHKDGIEKKFYPDGNLAQEINWKKGKQHGPTRTYTGPDEITDYYYEGRLVTRAAYDLLTRP